MRFEYVHSLSFNFRCQQNSLEYDIHSFCSLLNDLSDVILIHFLMFLHVILHKVHRPPTRANIKVMTHASTTITRVANIPIIRIALPLGMRSVEYEWSTAATSNNSIC